MNDGSESHSLESVASLLKGLPGELRNRLRKFHSESVVSFALTSSPAYDFGGGKAAVCKIIQVHQPLASTIICLAHLQRRSKRTLQQRLEVAFLAERR
jgi:hypothetical protein